ncbi:MAG: sigma-70 family RNA polymerase sigma factor [Phycisphaerales bacterium]
MSLLQRVARREPEAMRECVSRFGGLVWSLAKRAGLPEPECEDISQEIFAELWQVSSRYDPTVAGETAFVATIARRRIIDRQRRLGSQRTMMAGAAVRAASAQNTVDAQYSGEFAEEASKAMNAFGQLSSEQQRVLRMNVELGLTHELIAQATGMPLGTVKTHARRGLIKLREMLGEAQEPSVDRRAGA